MTVQVPGRRGYYPGSKVNRKLINLVSSAELIKLVSATAFGGEHATDIHVLVCPNLVSSSL